MVHKYGPGILITGFVFTLFFMFVASAIPSAPLITFAFTMVAFFCLAFVDNLMASTAPSNGSDVLGSSLAYKLFVLGGLLIFVVTVLVLCNELFLKALLGGL